LKEEKEIGEIGRLNILHHFSIDRCMSFTYFD